MMLSKGLTRFGLVAAVAALMLTMSIAVAGTANAQTPPATLYGKGLKAGDKVEAHIGGVLCGAATATAAGEWSLQVAANNACKPVANAAIELKLNGAAVNATPAAVWNGGGLPSNVANGYVLAAAPAAPAAPAQAATAAAVTPPKTGNAGMLGGSSATSMWLVLGIGLVALGAVAGTRAYAGRGR